MNYMKINGFDDIEKIIGFTPEKKTSNKKHRQLFELIAEDLEKSSLFNPENYSSFELTDVLSYLRMSHKYYLSKKLPEIEQQLLHVYNKFPDYKLFRILYLFFKEYKSHLIEHIDKEENTVFKYVDHLLGNPKNSTPEERLYLLQGSPSLNHFLANHTDTEQDLSAMRKVLQNDEDYRQLHPISMLLNQLATLENHLNIHARIEDEVFVPMALKLEQELLK